MKICYNAAAMLANNSLTRSDNALSQSLQRLSSGLKITGAKDNPSGLAMAKRMNAQIQGLSVAGQNASDGISITQTADGALSEVHDILQRMNELAVKAANGVMTDDDRATVNSEMIQLKEEIERIAKDTQFNGQTILDGTFDYKGYTDNTSVKAQTYSDSAAGKDYIFEALSVTTDADGKIESCSFTGGATSGIPTTVTAAGFEYNQNTVTINDLASDWSMTLSFENLTANATVNYGTVNVEANDFGEMRMQIGSNEGQVLEMRIPEISLKQMRLSDTDVSTKDGADEAIASIDYAIKYVSSARSRIGAYENRLEHTTNNIDVTSENMTGAYSRIMDVDMAEEMTSYTTQQVISQASTSMLAQANERPSQVLQLLQ